jgi:hypothetical protein
VGQASSTNPENEISYSTQYLEVFVKYTENEDCAKHRYFPSMKPESATSNIHIFYVMGSRCGQSSYNPDDLSSNDEE